MFALDFPFFQTSKSLLLHPSQVSIGYIRGVRKRINPPVQYALLALSLYGIFQFFAKDFLNMVAQNNFLSGFSEGFSDYEGSAKTAARSDKMKNAVNWLQSRNQFFLFLMIPCMGWLSSLFYRKKGYNFAEHLVIAIYAVAFSSLLTVVVGLLMASIGGEAVARKFTTISMILPLIGITWIWQQSLKGGIIRPILILSLSLLITGFLATMLLMGIIFS
ncbi:MAG: hypothetical protein AAF399_02805 [Bacteroidota bacterium]